MHKKGKTMHHRKSIRLKKYDYSSAGAYFITVCIQDRLCLMGEITNSQMILNDAGKMVQMQWSELPKRFPEIVIDEFMVMPNHFHGIIINNFETIESVGAPLVDARNGISDIQRAGTRPAPTKSAPSLGEIIGAFKSLTTNEYIHAVKNNTWPVFPGRLWQRNYFERIIRNEKELNNIRQYIINNPLKWELDKENPMHREMAR